MAKKRPSVSKNKKHLARLEIERRQTMAIRYSAIAVVVAVILLIGYGILDSTVLQARKPVVTVNGDAYTVHDLQVRTSMRREQLIQAYMNYSMFSQIYGIDLQSQMDQLSSTLNDPNTVGQQIMNNLVDTALIRQEATNTGITVSAQEIDDAIHEAFNFFPNGSPTPTLTPTPPVYSTLSPTQIAMVTLTPTPTVEPSPTVLPSPTATQDVNATPTVTPFPSATATPYTLDGFQQAYQQNIDQLKAVNATEKDYRTLVTEDLLRKKMEEIITKDVKPENEQVWARHIIVESETQAQQVYDRLMAGEDFGALALEFSQDASATKGGDLGWHVREDWDTDFANVAFSLKVGEISKPFQSQFGWHVVQVLGHEMRPLTADQFDQAKQTVFENWLSDLRSKADIVYTDGWEQYIPATPDLNTALQNAASGSQP